MAVIVAQLVDQSLLTPQFRGSNPVSCIQKVKLKTREAENGLYMAVIAAQLVERSPLTAIQRNSTISSSTLLHADMDVLSMGES